MGSDHIIFIGGGSSSSSTSSRKHHHHHHHHPHHQAMWVYPNPMRAGSFNPTERWGHSSCYYNRLIYVFGGCCGGMHFSDVVALDVETMAWSTILTTGEGPGPRDSHTAVLVGHKMVVFGGTTGFKKVNDLHILDLRSKVWTRPNCGGVIPSPRESHTATVIGHDRLVVYGGSGEGEANYLSDLHILDLKTMIWISPAVKGDVPVPRDSHCAVVVGPKLYVYGGDCGDRYQSDVNVLDIQTFTWFKLAIRGPWPGPRAGHASFAIGSKMYVIGGVGNKRYYNDVWVLDTNVGSWTRLEISGRQPQGRFSHTAVVANSDIVIYGGCGEDEHPLSEIVVLRLQVENSNKTSGCYCLEKRKMDGFVIRNCEDSMDSKKMRRPPNSKIVEIESESEPEEHSLSLSQHSSSSQSDRDRDRDRDGEQTPLKNTPPQITESQTPTFLLRHKKQSMQFVQNAPRLNFLHETQNRPKTVQHIRARLGTLLGRHDDVPECKSLGETPQSMNGREVRGKIDGCFDSGYLMTATVNGRAYRGVLFGPTNCNNPCSSSSVTLSNSMSRNQIPECGGGGGGGGGGRGGGEEGYGVFRQQPNQVVTGGSISSSMAVREPKIRNDLTGVVLTLGGGACSSSHAET